MALGSPLRRDDQIKKRPPSNIDLNQLETQERQAGIKDAILHLTCHCSNFTATTNSVIYT